MEVDDRIVDLERPRDVDDYEPDPKEMEEELLKVSQDLVAQADVNLKLAQKFRAASDKLQQLQQEEADACAAAIMALGGPDCNPDRYKGIPLEDLLAMKPEPSDKPRPGSASATACLVDLTSTPAQVEIQRLEELQRTIQGRIEQLAERVQAAAGEAEEMDSLRQVVHETAEKFRWQKDSRSRTAEDVKAANEKVEYLSQHIEKLMNHLRHEAAAKLKAYAGARSYDAELEALRNKNAVLAKRNATREKVITELQEGSRILEDQLRLMDDKYSELRGKLEYTRTVSSKDVKLAQTRADKLQMRWIMAQSMGAVPKALMDTADELRDGGNSVPKS